MQPQTIQGTRDLNAIDRVVSHPQWVMPDGVHQWLPDELQRVVRAVHPPGHERAGQPVYSTRSRATATRLLLKMHEQNIQSAPPPQTVNVHVAADVETAMERVKQLPPEQRKALAAAHSIVSRLATEQPPAN